HRTDAPLNIARLRRIGLVAMGREFDGDLAVARLAFY
ncbi:NADH:ubiquinone oxidoreductase, partial [Rhodopseudomonas palustris]